MREPRKPALRGLRVLLRVWDLVYYAALKTILGWPSSWLDWDVLFLIPATWTGPVLAPVLVSLGLVAAGATLLRLPPQAPSPLRGREWAIEGAAGAAIVVSFLWNGAAAAAGGVPERFPWWLFLAGYLAGLGCFFRQWSRAVGGRA